VTDTFTVISLNLRFGLADDGANSWVSRKKGVAAFLRSHKADFIGLQEANDFQVDFIAGHLAGYAYIGKRNPAPRAWQNNVLFFSNQWQCVSQKHLYLSPTPGVPSRFSDSRWPRQCTIGLFERGQMRLICINTHFDFEPPVQRKSAKIILDQISRLPSAWPVILMGDFNASPDSDCYRILTGSGTGIEKTGLTLKNVFDVPYPGTFHGFSGESTGDCIDWILYRGNIAPIACDLIRSKFNGVYPSDHFPVRTQFRWQAEC
jgi:endonuclease/exonuclease/phosphatase family metal-dependent hydrolase